MTKTILRKIIDYWRQTAEHDYKTMTGLFRIKRYSDSLFYGHIVLEKILKAWVVFNTKKGSPYSHNLTKLAELADLDLTNKEWNLLDEVNRFNIRARYPDYKLQIYKLSTKPYTEKYLKAIKLLYKKLCQEFNKKK